MMSSKHLEITERDGSEAITTTYIASGEQFSRVDIIRPKEAKSWWQMALDVFLPAGFPHSVTDDYVE